MQREITPVERDAILAALRLWQVPGILDHVPQGQRTDLLIIHTDNDTHSGLDNDQIDALCERINCEHTPSPTLPVCATCLSPDVNRDAWAQFNVETNEWELASTFDHTVCDACESECSTIVIPVAQRNLGWKADGTKVWTEEHTPHLVHDFAHDHMAREKPALDAMIAAERHSFWLEGIDGAEQAAEEAANG